MNDSDLAKIIRDTGPFQAEYQPLPIATRQGYCALPGMLPGVLDLPPVDFPDIPKVCAPLFTPYPVVPEPFTIPETCPEGISFTPKTVNIFASITADQPAGSITIGASKSLEDICNYVLDVPDVVIPCFPNGPEIVGGAAITVIDLNNDTSTTTTIELQQDELIPCRWVIDGDTTITIPKVPCPQGVTFRATTMDITSTCARIRDPKPVTIKPSDNNPCRYEIDMPDLKIPCYPNGPKVHGEFGITVTDRGTTVKTGKAEIVTKLGECCDFELGGVFSIETPCHTGISFTNTDWRITEPTYTVKNSQGVEQTIDLGHQTLQAGAAKLNDICNFGLNLPELKIPCHPDGISIHGEIKINTTDGTAGTIDFEKARSAVAACNWDIGQTITIPTPNCAGGFTWGPISGGSRHETGFKIYAGVGEEIRYYAPGQTSKPNRYHSLTFTAHDNSHLQNGEKNDCGAYLTGELNLGLPNFALACKEMVLGGQNKVDIYLNDEMHTGPAAASIVLRKNQSSVEEIRECGFEFQNTAINLPVLSCPNGYQLGTDDQGSMPGMKFYVDGVNEEIPHTFALKPTTNKEECGLTIQGSIHFPSMGGGGGGGFSYRPWSPQTNTGTVSMVFPEGNRCIYNPLEETVPGTAVPDTASGDEFWECGGCTGSRVFEPYKVIRCTERPQVEVEAPSRLPPEQEDKNIVKVVPRSYLFMDEKDKASTTIYGLDTPFRIEAGDKVYLELVFNAASNNSPSLLYAAICKSKTWDEENGLPPNIVPDVGTARVKTLTPAEAKILMTTSFQETAVDKIIGLSEADRVAMKDTLRYLVGTLELLSDTRPRLYKSWVLIADASSGKTGVDATPEHEDLSLQKSQTTYTIHQVLKNHLVLKGTTSGSTPVVMAVPSVGDNPDFAELETATIQTQKVVDPIDPDTGQPFIGEYLKVIMTIPKQTDLHDVERSFGGYGRDIHGYFTYDGSPATVNTWDNKKCRKVVHKIGETTGEELIPWEDVKVGLSYMTIAAEFQRSKTTFLPIAQIPQS